MPTSKEFLEYAASRLESMDSIRWRPMMGEYILYYRNKVVGGLYDNRLLLKNVPAIRTLLPHALLEAPYPGAREMVFIEALDNPDLLKQLLETLDAELPASKSKKRR